MKYMQVNLDFPPSVIKHQDYLPCLHQKIFRNKPHHITSIALRVVDTKKNLYREVYKAKKNQEKGKETSHSLIYHTTKP